MPLGLHADALRALTDRLAEALRGVRVHYNSYLTNGSASTLTPLDGILPQPNSKIGGKIAVILGDEPFSDFVYDELSSQLQKRPFVSDSESVPLDSLEGFSDLVAVATSLVAAFESLPWSYSLFASIPYEAGKRLKAEMSEPIFQLSDQYSLVQFAEKDTEYPSWQTSSRGLLDTPTEDRFSSALLYFRAQLKGYAGLWLGLRLVEEFQLALRAFFGIGIAERIFQTGQYSFFVDQTSRVVVFRRSDGAWLPNEPSKIDTPTANLIHSIGPHKLLAEDGSAASRRRSKDFLDRVRASFAEDLVSERLLGSAQWLCDSYATKNNLLAYVQAMVALEILFGDKAATDLVGLGELLANRCAYSIGTTRKQREEVLTDFRRIYATRSTIVHRGQSRLSRKDLTDLGTLKWMVARAIQQEIKLAMAT